MEYIREIEIIALVAILTLVTRAFPFVAFGRKGKPAPIITFLGRTLPAGVMAVLVVYCLKDISFTSVGGFIPQLISVAVVALLHVWKRNNLISIGVGTLFYMILIRLF